MNKTDNEFLYIYVYPLSSPNRNSLLIFIWIFGMIKNDFA